MTTATSADSYILFLVAGTSYALPSGDVRHMEMIEQITPVPNASPFLEGVVFSRGQIVPVINLRARFGFERVPHDLRTRLLVVESGERWVGLLVDSAREFVRIPPSAIQPPSTAITNLSTNYVHGVASLDGRLVLVLNVANVLDTALGPGDPAQAIDVATGGAHKNETRVFAGDKRWQHDAQPRA
jgi:chemotaxis signal transduction protein